ncbi:MAG TPA: hypothetical protein DEA82_07545 [Flavobacteriaceae bacterium]|nr:hypothetical protein [Flavobacteriaceae bacterium]HBR54037.1 hypothetical protein [Flavobacteriaceae bacterium]
MKFSNYLCFLAVCMLFVFGCKQQPEAIPDSRKNDYALYDSEGKMHRFSRYNNKKGIVLFVQGNGCPIVRNALTDFHAIVEAYQEDFQFFMINSNIQDDAAEITEEANAFKFQVPVLVDNAQLLADELDITITAEAIVLHPTSRAVLYRGPLNNRIDYETQKNKATATYLSDALTAIQNGETAVSHQEVTRGCTVTRLSKLQDEDSLTYSDDIGPILASNCVQCHRDGGRAPWSMDDYQTITGWSAMIKEVLLSKRMPPWKANKMIGDFQDDFSLPDSSARKIIAWIDNGMPPGNGSDVLQELKFPKQTWQKGEPDKVVYLEKEVIPATKLLPYQYQTFDLELTEDKWLKGVEIIPGNPKLLHHIVLLNRGAYEKSPITDRELRIWSDNYIALGAGANQATFFPEGTGVKLKKGTKLTVQLHYTPIGVEATDETKIGFYFHDQAPEKWFYPLATTNVNFEIPAHTDNVRLVATDTISQAINIHYLMPHMHYRGKEINMKVIKPSGEVIPLVSVPDFSIDWQWLYKLKEPVYAPKGSVIFVEGIFDNTVQNPLNPDASKDIYFGIQSYDEMLTGFFSYTLAD